MHESVFALTVAGLLAITSVAFAAGGARSGGGFTGNGNNGNNANGNSTSTAKPHVPNPVDELLSKYDTNHNGKLDKSEIAEIAKVEADKATEGLKYDTDKNGTLDASELGKWRTALAEDAKKKAAAAGNRGSATGGTGTTNGGGGGGA